jgi:hypothetical protein
MAVTRPAVVSRVDQRAEAGEANPCSRSRATSLVGALPKKRAYSRLN